MSLLQFYSENVIYALKCDIINGWSLTSCDIMDRIVKLPQFIKKKLRNFCVCVILYFTLCLKTFCSARVFTLLFDTKHPVWGRGFVASVLIRWSGNYPGSKLRPRCSLTIGKMLGGAKPPWFHPIRPKMRETSKILDILLFIIFKSSF